MRENDEGTDENGEFSEAYEMLFNVWSHEHLVDRALMYQPHGVHFRNRAKYTYILDQHINGADFLDLTDRYCNDDIPRATYCVWQNGEIVEWHRYGQRIHPKI